MSVGLSLLSSQSRFSIHISLIFLLCILQDWDLISVRSGFGDPIHFIPLFQISYPTITYLCILRDPPHGKKSILKFRATEEKNPKPTKPNRENRRILFPLISDFQKEENVPLGIFRQLHPQTQRRCLSHREFFLKFSLSIFIYFHLPPERSEISSEQFLLPAHSIKKYVAVMTAHRR